MKMVQRHSKVSQEMGGCSVSLCLFFFYQTEAASYFKELFVHICKMRNADHILLLKAGVSLLPGEAAAHAWQCPSLHIRVAW